MVRRKKYFVFGSISLLFITIILSLQTRYSKSDLVGHYITGKRTFIEKHQFKIKGVSGTISGCELDLYDNDLFCYKACGAWMEGVWKEDNGYLILSVKEGAFRSDSMNKIKNVTKDIPEDFLRFEIKKNKLLGVVKSIEFEDYYLNKLVKL